MSIFLPLESKFFAWERGILAEKFYPSGQKMDIGQKMDMKKRPLYILSLYVMFILAIFISPASPFGGGGGVKYAYLHTKNSVHLESNYTFEIRIIFGMLFEYLVGNLSVSMRVFPLVCVSMYILPLVCIFYG